LFPNIRGLRVWNAALGGLCARFLDLRGNVLTDNARPALHLRQPYYRMLADLYLVEGLKEKFFTESADK
jgi:hypothetical protein